MQASTPPQQAPWGGPHQHRFRSLHDACCLHFHHRLLPVHSHLHTRRSSSTPSRFAATPRRLSNADLRVGSPRQAPPNTRCLLHRRTPQRRAGSPLTAATSGAGSDLAAPLYRSAIPHPFDSCMRAAPLPQAPGVTSGSPTCSSRQHLLRCSRCMRYGLSAAVAGATPACMSACPLMPSGTCRPRTAHHHLPCQPLW